MTAATLATPMRTQAHMGKPSSSFREGGEVQGVAVGVFVVVEDGEGESEMLSLELLIFPSFPPAVALTPFSTSL